MAESSAIGSTPAEAPPSFGTVRYEQAQDGIARIVMDRPQARNAQNLRMSYELNAAFDLAARDDSVRVVILAGADPHFSAGHDLRERQSDALGRDFPVIGTWAGFGADGAEGLFAREQEIYLQLTRRWRNFPKPTIAAVQGKCIAGGLMLAWACDLIIASEDAEFCDPVVAMGVCGVEWFAHPWELGPRKAKEMLFTADTWSARDAERFGMVNQVVPRAELAGAALAMAARIAAKPSFALKMTKEAVNRSVDAMGQASAIDQVFGLHQLCHAHNMARFGLLVDPAGLPTAVANKAAGD